MIEGGWLLFQSMIGMHLVSPGGWSVEGANQQQKSYPCHQCSKQFSSQRDLWRHHLTHTGEKPFKCPHCPHRANRKGNLQTHIKTLHSDILIVQNRNLMSQSPNLSV